MATYPKIREWVKSKYGFSLKDCWIAHRKEVHGIVGPPAPNREGEERKHLCPPDKAEPVDRALRHFGLIP